MYSKKLFDMNMRTGETINTPPQALSGHVFLVFLHMFFGFTWFSIKPYSMVLHVLLFSKRNCQCFFILFF